LSFISFGYVLLFAFTWLCYFQLPGTARSLLLLGVGLLLYSWGSWLYFLLLAFSILASYFFGLYIRAGSRLCFGLAVGVNLAPLVFFKYGHFLHDIFRPASDGTAAVYLLPAGISFYTFQAISYLTDIRRGQISPCRNLLDYSLYHSFFPQLVAGPVERAAHLLPQIREVRLQARYNDAGIHEGLKLILLGFFKKMVLADSFALMADPAFGNPGLAGGGYLWCATYAFALQIYFDFSGYIDIGRGSAACLGIRLVENFQAPYRAASLADFWRRWNITIGTWFRDYVYIPLGGNRQGPWRRGMAVMATFALSGLWHGANWTFMGWGVFHGAFFLLERTWRRLPFWTRILITFHIVAVGWILFRAESFASAWLIFGKICSWVPGLLVGTPVPAFSEIERKLLFGGNSLLVWGLAAGVLLLEAGRGRLLAEAMLSRRILRLALYYLTLLLIWLVAPFAGKQFIYFQF
jgi:D-alanyl-lipoteichoic acid acyltransferase DltB (MBOAT superfamily)